MANLKTVTAIILVLSVSLIAVQPLYAQAEGSWTEKAPMSIDRYDLGVASVNGKIYAIGGRDSLSQPSGDMFKYAYKGVNEEYNPATDTWTNKTAMPTPLQDFGITAYNGTIYCFGRATIQIYNPADDTWNNQTAIPQPRTQVEANLVNGKIYVMGGRTGGQFTTVATNEAFDPATGEWTTKAPMLYPVVGHASAVVGTKIYIMGGQNEFKVNGSMTMPFNQIYDTETDTWSLGASLPNPVWDAAASALDSNVYLAGGQFEMQSNTTDLIQIYNPINDTWTFGPPMLTARFRLATTAFEGKLYAIGGANRYLFPGEKSLVTNEVYSPKGIQPTETPSPQQEQPITTTIVVAVAVVVGCIMIVALLVLRKTKRLQPLIKRFLL